MGFWRKIFALDGRRHEEEKHNFDPELRYCPACGAEYRPEIVRCVACGLELISGAERIAAWRQRQEERALRSREIAADDPVTSILRGKLPDMKASGVVLAAAAIAFRIVAAGGCRGG